MSRLHKRRASNAVRLIPILVFSVPAPQVAMATMSGPSQICESVAGYAAGKSGVPVAVLQAISLTETGRVQGKALRPWPWTVNMEGAGHWFESVDDARAYVFKEFKRGARSFDVGCFQINYKWHGDAFSSIDQMFDPVANAMYAAGLLRDLYSETGSWSAAAGAYHSRTPEYAARYRARFDRILANLDPASAQIPGAEADNQEIPEIPEIPDIIAAMSPPMSDPGQPRVNTFPFLTAGAPAGMGSLVPMVTTSGASLFAQGRGQDPYPGPDLALDGSGREDALQ